MNNPAISYNIILPIWLLIFTVQQQELDKQVGQQRRTDSTAKGWFLTWAMDGSGIEQNLHVFLLLTQQKSNTADGAGFPSSHCHQPAFVVFFIFIWIASPVRWFSVSAPGYVLYCFVWLLWFSWFQLHRGVANGISYFVHRVLMWCQPNRRPISIYMFRTWFSIDRDLKFHASSCVKIDKRLSRSMQIG